MVLFRFARETSLPAAEAWHRLTTWERHGEAVPLTRVTVRTPPPTRVGTVFVARSALGPVGFDDPMEVVGWHPPEAASPGRCRLEKRGSFVTGWAEFEVRPSSVGGATVLWQEELTVRRLPRLFDRVLAFAARRMFGRVVDRLTATAPPST
ncbi:hypothetical protein [Streptomyces alboniger]|uniref:SRPBCC family protein n=1 Tax=Streptomyces alboniger TaxID=132473 RepID=A0A5J6HP80_STRAD|nr:hypothetical protein [Streptomyces alboniger]QEV21012.1 SRPBCC family protein [Streptomyces alboniger]